MDPTKVALQGDGPDAVAKEKRHAREGRGAIGLGVETDWLWAATAGFVALGLMLRTVRYLLNFPLWCDESMLAANFLDRDFQQLLVPLDYRQVSPILFRLIELGIVRLLGFSEWTLRLFPFVCSIAGVLLFRHLAGRLLAGAGLALAVAVFAVSGWPLRYAAEVKPYASDLTVSLVLLTLAVEWWRRPGRVGWLWGLAAVAPLAVGLSFPAILVAGGIGVGLLPEVWRSRSRWTWAAYVVFGVGTLATFALLLPTYRTAPQDHDYFHRDWAGAFPPLDDPLRLVAWFVSINTGYLFAYPDGSERGGSILTTLCFVAGAVAVWRRGRRTVIALMLLPFAANLAAAAMHRYPYGMSIRTAQHLGPAICLLAGAGAAMLLRRLRDRWPDQRPVAALLIGLALLGFGRMAFDLVHPYRFASDRQARDFARWFWRSKSRNAEIACVKDDLGVIFDPVHWNKDQTHAYLCYKEIYSPRHRRGEPLRLDSVGDQRPLRCVLFNELPQETPEFKEWMARMSETYVLTRHERFPLRILEKQRGVTWDSLYMIYEFVPKSAVAVADGGADSVTR